MRNYSRQLNKDLYFDPYLFISITLLSLMGLVFLFSASQGSYDATIKQFVFVIFGLLLMFFLSQPDPDFYKNNSLILENTTGDSIAIGGGGLEVGFTEATYEGMYTLQNVDGSATVIELGNRENGYTTGIVATATASNMSAYGLSERLADGSTKGFAASNSALALTDDIRINDVQVGKTTLASAEAKVNAINAISDQTGVTATAETQLILELDFDQDATSVSFALNGNAVDVKLDNSVYDVASAINAANINLEATAIENGRLKITSHSGGDIILGLSAVTAFVTSIQDANGHTQAVGASVTTQVLGEMRVVILSQ